MAQPVDLRNLREITDGDAEMEKELFKEFIKTADSYIVILGELLNADKNELWRTTAHAFKGLALNLGATNLGELCKKAQENNTASLQDKTSMLEAIRQEYAGVNDFLNSESK